MEKRLRLGFLLGTDVGGISVGTVTVGKVRVTPPVDVDSMGIVGRPVGSVGRPPASVVVVVLEAVVGFVLVVEVDVVSVEVGHRRRSGRFRVGRRRHADLKVGLLDFPKKIPRKYFKKIFMIRQKKYVKIFLALSRHHSAEL